MKFKMKSLVSIFLATAMLATMAVPVFAEGLGTTGGGDEDLFNSMTNQERIIAIDPIHKVNDDGTVSSFRADKLNSSMLSLDYSRHVPFIINMKVGETIRIASGTEGLSIGYDYGTKSLTSKLVESSNDTQRRVYEFNAFAEGVYSGYVRYSIYSGQRYANMIIWNVTTDGSPLPDATYEYIVAATPAKQAEFDAEFDAEFNSGSDEEAADAEEASSEKNEQTEQAPPVVTHYAEGENYTVKAGDTLGVLSLNNYGSYNYADELYKANAAILKKSGGKIYKDLAIIIPDTIAKGVNKIAPLTVGEGEKLYTVKSGDTLGTIAKTAYGNANKYKAIFERNSDRLKNVNTIYTGQVIVLP